MKEKSETIIDLLRPKPLPAYIPETEESKKFHEVTEVLYKSGLYGEDNTIETCRILGVDLCLSKC